MQNKKENLLELDYYLIKPIDNSIHALRKINEWRLYRGSSMLRLEKIWNEGCTRKTTTKFI